MMGSMFEMMFVFGVFEVGGGSAARKFGGGWLLT